MKNYSRNSLCFCGSGKKQKKCHSDIHPESKAANLIRGYISIDQKIKEYQKTYGHNTPCGQGCSRCCYDDFSISLLEISYILYEINRTWSKEDIKELFDNCFASLEEYKEQKPELFKLLEADGTRDQSLTSKQYMSTFGRNGFPCPFLEVKSGSCRIYNYRPIVCRTTGTSHSNDGTTSEINMLDSIVCELIPSLLDLRYKTPNTFEEQTFLEREVLNCYDSRNNEQISFRNYPIFYWIKIFHKKNSNKSEIKIFENGLFNQSSVSYDNFMLSKLGGKK